MTTSAPARFLVTVDVDSTLIRDEVIELLADEAGSRESVANITERAMLGEIDFEHSLRERVATLEGLPTSVFETVLKKIVLTDGAHQLIAGVHRGGGRIGAISGGFTQILTPLATRLGLDHWKANQLEVRDGRMTGGVIGPVVDAQMKASILRKWASLHSLPHGRTVAVGDGANDILMMSEAALSVAFMAKPRVRDKAHIVIDTPDLSQVLPLLGLRG